MIAPHPHRIDDDRLTVAAADAGRPLRELLNVSPELSRLVGGCPTAFLRPSVRLTNGLARAHIQTLDELLSVSLNQLWAVRGLGVTTLQEVVDALAAFLATVPEALRSAPCPVEPDPDDRSVAELRGEVPARPSGEALVAEWLYQRSAALSPPGAAAAAQPHRLDDGRIDVTAADAKRPLHELLEISPEICRLVTGYPWTVLAPSVRLTNCLIKSRIETLDELLSVNLQRLRNIRNLGDTSIQQLVDSLAAYLETAPDGLQRPSCRIEGLGLDRETAAALRRAGIDTMEQLLEALSPLHPVLQLDLAAFTMIWDRLTVLQLTNGDALAARDRLGGGDRFAASLDYLVQFCQNECTPKQWRVLRGRFGIGYTPDGIPIGCETRAELCAELELRRNEVGQIEASAIRCVTAPGSPIRGLARTLAHLCSEAGGVLSLGDTVEELSRYVQPGIYPPEAICYLVYELSAEFEPVEPGRIYAHKDAPFDRYRAVVEAAPVLRRTIKNDLHSDTLVSRLVEELRKTPGLAPGAGFVRACLRANGGYNVGGSPAGPHPTRTNVLTAGDAPGEAGASIPSLDSVVEFCERACTAKEWRVLQGRFGIGSAPEGAPIKVETLDALSVAVGLSPSRIGVIEQMAVRTVAARGRPVNALARTLRRLLSEAGGVLSLGDTAEELTRLVPPGTHAPEAICYLVYELPGQFARVERRRVYAHRDAPWQHYGVIIEAARNLWRTSTRDLRGDNFVFCLLEDLNDTGVVLEESFVRACLRAGGRFLDEEQRSTNLRRQLKALIVDALRRLGRPARVSEIAAELNARNRQTKTVSDRHVHNILTKRRDLFAYVARSTYGLSEWGLKDRRIYDSRRLGLIHDLAEEYLESHGEPASAEEIVVYVLSRKRCRKSSVTQRLCTDPRFHRFGEEHYGLKKWVSVSRSSSG